MARKLAKSVVARYGGFAENSFYWELVKYNKDGAGRRPRLGGIAWRRCYVKRPEFRGRERRGRSRRVFRRIGQEVKILSL